VRGVIRVCRLDGFLTVLCFGGVVTPMSTARSKRSHASGNSALLSDLSGDLSGLLILLILLINSRTIHPLRKQLGGTGGVEPPSPFDANGPSQGLPSARRILLYATSPARCLRPAGRILLGAIQPPPLIGSPQEYIFRSERH